jgi:hypothetical protein
LDEEHRPIEHDNFFQISSYLGNRHVFGTYRLKMFVHLSTVVETNWMEPPLGQASFFLLCMQYARAQMQNLGIKPYTEYFRHRRAARLITKFPQYNRYVLQSFSEGDPLSPDHNTA